MHFNKGPDILFKHLASIFRSCLFHGTVTTSLLACAFLPLLKSSQKDLAATGSYRAIAGSSLILKLFEKVLLLVWGHLLGTDSLQFGFKAKISTTQCSWMVQEVIGHYLRHGTNPIITVLDCSKAFDTVSHYGLFLKLMEKGVPFCFLNLIIYWYLNMKVRVLWRQTFSQYFHVLSGTKQGGVLSPKIFTLYMDELIRRLRDKGIGCHIMELFLACLLYADDMCLIAPSRGAMQKMLDICVEFCEEFCLSFNIKKLTKTLEP